MNILATLLKAPLDGLVNYLNERQKLRSAERIRKAELADAFHARQLELVKANLQADVDWEMEFARQAATSWKDEFELLLISVPLVGCWFFPVQTLAGFNVLAETPKWYVGLVLTIYLANYGIRRWRRK